MVADPAGSWEPSTAEAYIDSQIAIEASTRLAQDTYIQSQIPLADEEDITKSGSYLKFKDRIYNQTSPNGMGRIILRNNIVNGVNTLTQSMINQANTIYEIRYDFTLSSNFTVPANCILDFQGGSINGNYTLTGNNTGIVASLVKIFDTTITLAGTWNVVEAYPEWFGAKGDRVTDDRLSIQKTIDYFTTIRFRNKGYLIGSYYDSVNKIGLNIGQNISDGKSLIGTVPNDYQDRSTTILAKEGIEFNTLLQVSSNNIHVTDIRFEGNRTSTVVNDYEFWDGELITKTMFSDYHVTDIIRIKSDINYISGLVFTRVKVSYCTGHGFYLRCFGSTFDSCVTFYCGTTSSGSGFYFRGCLDSDIPNIDNKGNCTSLILNRCYTCYSCGFGFRFEKITYSTLISCACDQSGFNQYGKTIESRANGNYSYTYSFERCFGISLVSCGLEQCPRGVFVYKCNAIKIIGCSFDVYLNRFFPSDTDDYNFKVQDSNEITIENSYLTHTLADNGHLVRVDNSHAVINDCYVNYNIENRRKIDRSGITVNNDGSYVLDYDIFTELGEQTTNNNYAVPVISISSDGPKGYMSFLNIANELLESIGIFRETFTGSTTIAAWRFGLLIIRRAGSNACGLYMCDNTNVTALSQNISEITVTVENVGTGTDRAITITSTNATQGYNYLLLSVPTFL